MGIRYGYCTFCLLVLVLLLPCLAYSQSFNASRATYYSTPDGLGTPTGACGYGGYGRNVYNGYVTGVSKLYRNAVGCGACYQVICKVPQLCTSAGVNVVVTDYGEGDRTDFILSSRAFGGLAKPNMASKLFAYGVVDVQYRRVSCQYPGQNVMFKVHENSRFPDYLAIVLLYQGGENDILAVQLWQENYKKWVGMRRAYGAVWDMPNPPKGYITLRIQVKGNGGVAWYQAVNVLPSNWKPGVAYGSSIVLK